MKTPYSKLFSPPAPVLEVSVALQDQEPIVTSIESLIDTGADGSFIPFRYITMLGTDPIYQVRVHSHLGSTQIADVYSFDLVIGEWRLPTVDLIGDTESDLVILGRNVLSKLRLLLDGPIHQTSILE